MITIMIKNFAEILRITGEYVVFCEINPWDLIVAKGNQSCLELPILIDFEHPIALDTASIVGKIALLPLHTSILLREE